MTSSTPGQHNLTVTVTQTFSGEKKLSRTTVLNILVYPEFPVVLDLYGCYDDNNKLVQFSWSIMTKGEWSINDTTVISLVLPSWVHPRGTDDGQGLYQLDNSVRSDALVIARVFEEFELTAIVTLQDATDVQNSMKFSFNIDKMCSEGGVAKPILRHSVKKFSAEISK